MGHMALFSVLFVLCVTIGSISTKGQQFQDERGKSLIQYSLI